MRTAAQAIAGLDVEPNAVTVEQQWALIACRARTGLLKEHAGGGSCAPELCLQQPRRSHAEPRFGSQGDSYQSCLCSAAMEIASSVGCADLLSKHAARSRHQALTIIFCVAYGNPPRGAQAFVGQAWGKMPEGGCFRPSLLLFHKNKFTALLCQLEYRDGCYKRSATRLQDGYYFLPTKLQDEHCSG